MKIRHTHPFSQSAGDSLALIENQLLANVPTGFLPSSARISLFDFLRDITDIEVAESLFLVTSEPQPIQVLAKAVEEGDSQQLTVCFQGEAAELLRILSTMSDGISLNGLEVLSGIVIFRLVASEAGDREFNDFLQGFMLGLSSSPLNAGESVAPDRTDPDITEKYLNTLLFLQQLGESGTAMIPKSGDAFSGSAAAKTSDADLNKITQLTQEVIRLQSTLTSLQRKYNSLSNSKLGKLTLKYWDYSRSLKR